MSSVEPISDFRLTVYPFARRACAYSCPRTFSSAKFLSPRVTAGLPAPGPVADDAGVVELVLDEVLLDFELPHAASNTPAAASAANAATARPRATWNMIESLSSIRCLLVVTFVIVRN